MTGRGRGNDRCTIRDVHVGRGGLDEATVAAMWSGDVQTAGNGDGIAVGEAAQEADFTLLAGGEGLGLDEAFAADGGGHELACATSGQKHVAAVGADRAAVADQGVDRAFIDGDVDQATEVQGDPGAGGEVHRTALRRDAAVVDDAGSDQSDGPAADGDQVALVDHEPGAGVAERIGAGDEVLIGEG